MSSQFVRVLIPSSLSFDNEFRQYLDEWNRFVQRDRSGRNLLTPKSISYVYSMYMNSKRKTRSIPRFRSMDSFRSIPIPKKGFLPIKIDHRFKSKNRSKKQCPMKDLLKLTSLDINSIHSPRIVKKNGIYYYSFLKLVRSSYDIPKKGIIQKTFNTGLAFDKKGLSVHIEGVKGDRRVSLRISRERLSKALIINLLGSLKRDSGMTFLSINNHIDKGTKTLQEFLIKKGRKQLVEGTAAFRLVSARLGTLLCPTCHVFLDAKAFRGDECSNWGASSNIKINRMRLKCPKCRVTNNLSDQLAYQALNIGQAAAQWYYTRRNPSTRYT